MTLSDFGLWPSILSAIVSFVGFPLVIAQLVIARKQQLKSIELTTAQTLLSLDAVLASYSGVATRLSSTWAHPNEVNPTQEELPGESLRWAIRESLRRPQGGPSDVATLRALYDYRVWNIWNNHRIVEDVLQNPKLRS